MVSPREAMVAVARTVANSGKLPEEMGVVLHEADIDSEDADVGMPTLEIQPDTVDNVVVGNTDFIGYTTDEDGNRTGRVYASEYEMTISIGIWTAENDNYDPDAMGKRLREALYPHSSYGPSRPFLDEENNPINGITYFRLAEGDRVDDLVQNPTVRRWSQEVELWGLEEFKTSEDYIVGVNYPSSGDFNDSNDDGVTDNT